MLAIVLRRLKYLSLCCLLILLMATGRAQAVDLFAGLGGNSFLPVEQAFEYSGFAQQDSYYAEWQIADGYYLYQDHFKFQLEPEQPGVIGAPQFSKTAQEYDDPEFGKVRVFYDQLALTLPINYAQLRQNATLTLIYQGCAEAGLCYPPQKIKIPLQVHQASADTTQPITAKAAGSQAADNPPSNVDADLGLVTANDYYQELGAANFIQAILKFFGFGLLLAFSPCVLPMIPILSSIIVGQEKRISPLKGFSLAAVYVLGMASIYAVAGVVVGLLGDQFNLQQHLQTPQVIIPFSLLFVLLALSMFGFYELQLPSSWQTKLSQLSGNQQGGSYLGVFLMGLLAALVLSPCVTAPVAGSLLYISETGDPVLGATALFSLALGMGAPLLLVGAGGGHLLPKAGGWMDQVKVFFGVVLLGLAIWLVERVISAQLTLALWAGLFIVYAVYLGALDKAEGGIARCKKGAGVVLLIYGALLALGAASGQSGSLTQPLKLAQFGAATGTHDSSDTHRLYQQVNSLEELQQAVAAANAQGLGAMLDYYADWCVSCKIMEKEIFSQSDIQTQLKQVRWMQVDLTDMDDAKAAMLTEYQLQGPPAIVFFDRQGEEINSARIQGELSKDLFSRFAEQRILPLL